MNRIVLYVDEEGNWVAECLNPMCVGQAKTKEKALEQVKKAIQFTGRMWEPDCGGMILETDAVELTIYEVRSSPMTAHLN